MQGWLNECFESLREEPNAEEPGYYSAWIDPPELDVQLLSLRTGDCLQCLRSALDHLAFELAAAFTVPMTEEIEKNSAFPILSDVDKKGNFGIGPDKWRSALASDVSGMDPKAQDVIEGLQPYKRGQAYATDPLWRLNTLNNIDKHRALHVVTRVMSGATLPVPGLNYPVRAWVNVESVGSPDGEGYIFIAGDIAAEGPTEVARWPAKPIDPRKEMYLGFRPVLDVVFDPSVTLLGGDPLLSSLREIDEHIASRVLPPLIGFLK